MGSNSNGRRRVVVTGMGVVSPLGQSVEEFWGSLVQGKSGIGPITLADTSHFPSKIAGEVSDFDPVDQVVLFHGPRLNVARHLPTQHSPVHRVIREINEGG